MTAIETTRLTKSYGSITAVDGLDLRIDDEVFCLVGPNGVGKSTTIGLLLGHTPPTDGSVSLFGVDPLEDPRIRTRVGFVPDDFGHFPRLTGFECLEYMIRAKDTDEDPQALLERVNLAAAGDRRASAYSTGMSKRLALAMALTGQPDLLILDEPFAGLDPTAVRTVRRLITEEAERGATVVVSSHVLDQVERLADRIALLLDGSVVAEGPLAALKREIATEDGVETYTLTIEDVYARHVEGVTHA